MLDTVIGSCKRGLDTPLLGSQAGDLSPCLACSSTYLQSGRFTLHKQLDVDVHVAARHSSPAAMRSSSCRLMRSWLLAAICLSFCSTWACSCCTCCWRPVACSLAPTPALVQCQICLGSRSYELLQAGTGATTLPELFSQRLEVALGGVKLLSEPLDLALKGGLAAQVLVPGLATVGAGAGLGVAGRLIRRLCLSSDPPMQADADIRRHSRQAPQWPAASGHC